MFNGTKVIDADGFLDLAVKIGKIAAGLVAIALVACLVRNARAETLEQEDAAQDLRDAEAVGKRHSAELMKIPHVQAVTGELDGRNEAAILIEVDNQKNVDAVTRQLPSKIEGYPVEVDERIPENGKGDFAVFGYGSPSPPPTIDKNGYYHHAWLKPSAPATTPGAQP
jgi:hypothetical protein